MFEELINSWTIVLDLDDIMKQNISKLASGYLKQAGAEQPEEHEFIVHSAILISTFIRF